MPEKITKMTSSKKCRCCPYGFHIDRDFVHFCDTLYNARFKQPNKKKKENKSLESYLGIGTVIKKDIPSLEDTPFKDSSIEVASFPSASIKDASFKDDSFKNAVNDFEETWEKSLKKSSSNNDISKKRNDFFKASTLPNWNKKEAFFSKSPVPLPTPITNGLPKLDVPIFDPLSTTSYLNAGVQKSVLNNIREQMASSLSRLKELEEQVKCIPTLEAQLSSLKEEKKVLQNQLKAHQNDALCAKDSAKENKSELKKLEKQISSLKDEKQTLLNQVKLLQNNKDSEKNSVKEISLELKKLEKILSNKSTSTEPYPKTKSKEYRTVGTHCSVLKRDIGVGHIPSKFKSIAVNCDLLPLHSNITRQSSESLESDLESIEDTPAKVYSHSSTQVYLSYLHKSTNTELEINHSLKSTPVKTFSNKNVQTVSNNCIKFNKITQTLQNKGSKCNKHVQTLSNSGSKCDVALGDFDVNEPFCSKCSAAVGKEADSVSSNHSKIKTTGILSDDVSHTKIKSDINICDKCSATIHSVARGLAAKESKIPTKSKPPKLKIPIKQETESKPNTFQINTDSSLDNRNEEKKKSIEDLKTLMNLSNRKRAEISQEIKAACKVLHDCLQICDKKDEKSSFSSLSIIQTEWFKIANQKNADPLLIEDHLDMFEEHSKLLLQRIVNLSDTNGNTALHYAVSYGNYDVVSILIDSKVCDVNKKNKAGYTSIMLIAALSDIKNETHQYVVQRLCTLGDVNMRATQNGQTALMLAVSHGRKEVARLLLEAGSEINLQDKDGSTALMCAAEHGHIEIVKLLLSQPECDPFIVDNDDCNALTIAMEAGHKDIGLLIYTNMNFSRGSSPYSSLKSRKLSSPSPSLRTPRTPPLPSPSARSTNSIPASFSFST